MNTVPGDGETAPPPALPFGPYEGRSVTWVAVVDPPYLRDLITEEVGSAELRAAAARALARRGRLRHARLGRPVRLFARLSDEVGGSPNRGEAPSPARNGSRANPWRRPLATIASRSELFLPADGPWPVAILLIAGALLIGWRVSATREASPSPVGAGPGVALLGSTPEAAVAAPNRGAPIAPSSRAPRELPSHVTPTPDLDTPPGTPPPCGARVPGAIPAASAADFLDTFQAVEFHVAITKDTGKVTFLNSHDPYQGHFYVAIFPDDYDLYPAHPAEHFRGRCIVVQGRIERYRGVPQIVLRGPEDVRVLGDVQPLDDEYTLDDGREAESYTETTAPTREIP